MSCNSGFSPSYMFQCFFFFASPQHTLLTLIGFPFSLTHFLYLANLWYHFMSVQLISHHHQHLNDAVTSCSCARSGRFAEQLILSLHVIQNSSPLRWGEKIVLRMWSLRELAQNQIRISLKQFTNSGYLYVPKERSLQVAYHFSYA
jgi:hypothetical protein